MENQTLNSEQTKSELENGNQYAAQILSPIFITVFLLYMIFFFLALPFEKLQI